MSVLQFQSGVWMRRSGNVGRLEVGSSSSSFISLQYGFSYFFLNRLSKSSCVCFFHPILQSVIWNRASIMCRVCLPRLLWWGCGGHLVEARRSSSYLLYSYCTRIFKELRSSYPRTSWIFHVTWKAKSSMQKRAAASFISYFSQIGR